MTIRDIVLGNLRRRKAKAAFVVSGLLIGVSTVVAFISLVDTLTRDINHKLEKYGANILIVPKTESLSLTYGGLALGGVSYEMQEIKQEDLAKIHTIKNHRNIGAVGPMVMGPMDINGQRVLLVGIDFDVYQALRPWWRIRGRVPGRDEALVGSEAARILRLRENHRLAARGRTIEVSGILEPTGSQDDQIIFARLATAQTLLGKEGRISMVEVAALCSGCPIEEMVKQLSGALPGSTVMAIKQVVQGRMETIGHFKKFALGLSFVVLLVGGMVVLVTMMGNVRERTSEIGIFRAVGFRKTDVMRIVLLEAAIVSALAGVAGYAVGIAGTYLVIPHITESREAFVSLDPVLGVAAFGMAMVMGLASSAYPALMASRLDPNEALRSI